MNPLWRWRDGLIDSTSTSIQRTYKHRIGRTSDTAVVILFPPEAPIINRTFPSLSVKMVGHMEENGRLPGSGKLNGDGEISPTTS